MAPGGSHELGRHHGRGTARVSRRGRAFGDGLPRVRATRHLLDRLGDPKKEEAVFAAISPLRRADRIRAATYVGYTEFDAGEKISQAKSLESALRRNNVPCEVHSFHDEYGGLYHLRSRVEYYDGVEAFLAKNLR